MHKHQTRKVISVKSVKKQQQKNTFIFSVCFQYGATRSRYI